MNAGGLQALEGKKFTLPKYWGGGSLSLGLKRWGVRQTHKLYVALRLTMNGTKRRVREVKIHHV
jgi:hypothetical protein